MFLMQQVQADGDAEVKTTNMSFLANGWDKSPFYMRAQIVCNIVDSRKNTKQQSPLVTGLHKAKVFLQDECLHDMSTVHDKRYFYYYAKCFHSFQVCKDPRHEKTAVYFFQGS